MATNANIYNWPAVTLMPVKDTSEYCLDTCLALIARIGRTYFCERDMGYIDRNLLPGERVVYRTKLHWVEYTVKMFWFLLAGVIAAVPLLIVYHGKQPPWTIALPIPLFGFAGFLVARIIVITSEFAVTNNRVLVKVGFIRRHSLEIVLQQVEGIGVDQGILGRILGFGTIIVSGTGTTREFFIRIRNPLEFRRQVQVNARAHEAIPGMI
jgi:membrane protein YdbS with pleckstrin-like domain